MHTLLRAVFLPKGLLEGSSQARRRSLLTVLLWMVAAFALLFYFIPHPDYDSKLNLSGALGYACLAIALRLGSPYVLTAHISMLWSMLYLGDIAVQTGGINSPVLTWVTVATLSAILLVSRVAAVFWVLALLAVNMALLVGAQQGWISSDINMHHDALLWTVLKNIFVLSLVMYVAYVTKVMHQNQVHELEESNFALELADEALIKAQTNKDQFIASVGHELRTPMNAILGLNGVLRAELSASAQDVEVVDRIRASTEQVLSFVSDILDFAQLQAGRLRLQEQAFPLKSALTDLQTPMLAKAQNKGLAFSFDISAVTDDWVNGDRQRLVQVLHNVLDHAIQNTETGSVSVKAAYTNERLYYEIKDTREDVSTAMPTHVTALGLSLCDGLVQLQRGVMTIEPVNKLSKERGAHIRLELPLPIAEIKEEPLSYISTWQSEALKFLVVDDNAVNLMVARMMLNKCFPNAQVVEATCGVMALEKLKEQQFDLMLIDILMPDIDGMHVTQALRHRFAEPLCHIPVLALTANVNSADRDQCLASGINDVLHKPLTQAQLISKVTHALTTHAAWGKA
jgi:signal transduction histidine kinase/CheY-like chemotaxis protein